MKKPLQLLTLIFAIGLAGGYIWIASKRRPAASNAVPHKIDPAKMLPSTKSIDALLSRQSA